MTKRQYYSISTGINQMDKLDLPILLELFEDVYSTFSIRRYFSQSLSRRHGDMDVYIFQKMHKLDDKNSGQKSIDYFAITRMVTNSQRQGRL